MNYSSHDLNAKMLKWSNANSSPATAAIIAKYSIELAGVVTYLLAQEANQILLRLSEDEFTANL